MNARRLAAIIALALFAGLLVWRSGAGAGRLRYYAPEAYVERADVFIRAGYLQASCREDLPRIEEQFQDVPAADRQWYEESYLAEDVRRFNRDPASFGWTFVVDDDCRLRGVNPTVHKVELPFAESIRWLGSLFYRGGGSHAALRSAERAITLARPDAPVTARAEGTTRVGAEEDLREQPAVLLHFVGGRGQPAARLFHVGEEVVVHNRVRRNEPEATRLLGFQLQVGRLARLETGDWLNLEAERPSRVEETFVFVGGEALETASRMRLRNDRYERATDDPGLGLVSDPVADRTSPYLDLVAGSVEAAINALPEAEARRLASGFDVQLTLGRRAQTRLGSAFRGHCANLRRQRRTERAFTAGMAVLDGRTGDVLALATYPHEEDLARLRVDDDDRRRLLRNQNLVLHPIGSAGKPFFFAAIADAFPALATMVIEPYAGEEARRGLLHCEIPKGYRVPQGHGAPVDFPTALQISSNRYTMELAALALASRRGAAGGPLESFLPPDREVAWPLPGRASGISVAGQRLNYAPDLGGFVHHEVGRPETPESAAARVCRSLETFEQVAFRSPLEALTGADTYWGTDPQGLGAGPTRGDLDRAYRTGRYDLRPWRPLLEHLFAPADDERRWRIRAAAQEMSPERVNLAFNQVSRLREDFVSLLLGGGTSLWTNVQLTEALSRLVTGRAVEARLVARVLPRAEDGSTAPPPEEPPRTLAPELPIRAAARTSVLEGIERVGRPGGGTAPIMDAAVTRHLRQRFPNDRIDLYSKTGSPILEFPVPRQAGAALERLVGRSRLRLARSGLVVALQDGQVPYSPPGGVDRGDFERAVARALGEVGYPRPSRWLVEVETEILDELAEQLAAGDPAAIEGPVRVEGGALALDREDKLFRQRLATGKGAVYIFSIVRRPGSAAAGPPTAADLESPDTRVVTVAIHFTIGPDAGLAVETARAMLPELAPLLE